MLGTGQSLKRSLGRLASSNLQRRAARVVATVKLAETPVRNHSSLSLKNKPVIISFILTVSL